MVVWRSSVLRTVHLHTATMGVHRACLYRSACPNHSPGLKSFWCRPFLSYAISPDSRTNWRALGVFFLVAHRGQYRWFGRHMRRSPRRFAFLLVARPLATLARASFQSLEAGQATI